MFRLSFIAACRFAFLACAFAAHLSGSAAELAWQSAPGFRWRELNPAAEGKTGFTLVDPALSRITFTNHLADQSAALNRILENGSGVALGDIDNDGWCDIYFCRLEGSNVLYRNRGDWTFHDVTSSAGVACPNQYSTGAVFADADGDGDVDLLVTSIGGGTREFVNDGQGLFTEVTGSRLVRRFGATSLALGDIDADGDLDLYVTNYRVDTYRDKPPGLRVEAKMVSGKIVITPEGRFIPLMQREGGVEVMERGDRDFLYLNDGQGRFAPVSWTTGSFVDENNQPLKEAPQDWGLTATFRDVNGDLAPDIYVCNDFFYFPDRLWISETSQRFRAVSKSAMRNQSLSSMAVDFADINRDGHVDFFVADMLSRSLSNRQRQRPNMMKGLMSLPLTDPDYRPEVARNTLFLNRGDGTWTEIAQLAGLDATEWSWGAVFLDVDLDGWEDLLIPTGNNHDVQDADALKEVATFRHAPTPENKLREWSMFPKMPTAKLAFRNRRDLTFEEVGAAWGFNQVGISHGMALADLDNDGDLDIVVNNLNTPASLYRNDSPAARVAVRLKGNAPNSHGVGARIRVVPESSSSLPIQSQEMICGGRYLSCDDTLRVFAAGSPSNHFKIEVTWRSGLQSIVTNAAANRSYEVAEATARSAPLQQASARPALFDDASNLINHAHRDEPFDDASRQPLISHRLSQSGPAIAWHDLDTNGWDDLIISGSRGSRLAAFMNSGQGRFKEVTDSPVTQPVTRDQTAVIGSRIGERAVLLAASSSYEDAAPTGTPVRQYDLSAKFIDDTLPGAALATGPLAMADVDGDGDLDLFVGARCTASRYPEAAPSRLYRNAAGKFEQDSINADVLSSVGLVSGAVFSDVDGDGDPDLVLACDWGPIRILRNDAGRFRDATTESGLDAFAGRWNGVAAGDFNGDGRMDLIASNWGRNSHFQAHLHHPIRLYTGDFDENGTVEGIETFFADELKAYAPWRDFDTMAKALPPVRERFPTFRAYGSASIEALLGDKAAKARVLSINTVDSMLFLNRGSRFEAKPLPIEAQFAPAFGISVADFNGDGAEDIFLSQNFFAVDPEISRYDSGVGQLLLGDGRGEFKSVSPAESGIRLLGEQRGCAVSDFDGDGRVDLAVGQNNGPTKLFKNATAKPGIIVRLRGPAGNPTAIGAVLRLESGGTLGPARELQCGSGFASQDSSTVVLAATRGSPRLQVRWPDGKLTQHDAPAGATRVEIDPSGKITP